MIGLQGLELTRPELTGRGVVVTGGSMGIGLACASEVLASGGRVMLVARGQAALEDAARGLSVRYGEDRVWFMRADVAVAEEIEAVVEAGLAAFGRIDGLVHAAAVIGPIGHMLDVDDGEWARTIETNLLGTFRVARAVGRAMRESGGGRMVLFSGGGATSPFPNYSAYAASKAAVVRLAETLALELAEYGIEVNALAPGFVATRMHEATLAAGVRAGAEYLERTRRELAEGGVPAELGARAAAFMISDRFAGITGRLVAAPWDRWWTWPERTATLLDSDDYTLRRVVPQDREEADP